VFGAATCGLWAHRKERRQHGGHTNYIDLFKHVQAGGKAVQVWGSPEEVKLIHRELRPEKTQYHTWAGSRAEAEALFAWFARHT
jgi:hypothetical protein